MSKEPIPESSAGCDVCMMNFTKEENLTGCDKYSYKYMCMPSLPFLGKTPPPQWYGKDEKLPLFLSLLLGLQHALAMVIGIATSGGYLITNDTCLSWQFDSQMCDRMPWMISCAWLTSGILTIVQVFRAKIVGTPFYLGTGLISVMGTSFTFLPIVRTMVVQAIVDAKSEWPTCGTIGNATLGTLEPVFTGDCCYEVAPRKVDCYGAGAKGYGDFLGTVLVASLVEIILFGLMKPDWVKRLFPPVVTGACIMLIGGSLIGTGMKYAGGGVFCAENTESKTAVQFAAGITNAKPQMCEKDNGDVWLSFGSPEYVGLAFSVIAMSILLQMFGSPFLKSTYLIWALAFGCCVASVGYDGPANQYEDEDGNKPEWASYFRSDFLDKSEKQAPSGFTFLWAQGTYPIGFSGENFLPILIGFCISSAETIGDVTMTCKYSKVHDPEEVGSRVQGGLLADGVNSFFAALFGSPPNTTFSQNNGLIALTRCASRSVGFSCAFWLIMLGIIAPFGAVFASIPICVVGGLVLQCFTSVFVSGMATATQDFTRRNQFILTIALGIGLGVAMEGHIFDWPGPYTFFRRNLAFNHGFWPESETCNVLNAAWIDSDGLCKNKGFFGINNGNCCDEYSAGKRSWRRTVLLVMKIPYAIGFLFAFILNLIIPEDKDDEWSSDFHAEFEVAGGGKKMATSTSASDVGAPPSSTV